MLHDLGGLTAPEGRNKSVVDVAFHTRTKFLQQHFRTVGEAQRIMMRTFLQTSESDVLPAVRRG